MFSYRKVIAMAVLSVSALSVSPAVASAGTTASNPEIKDCSKLAVVMPGGAQSVSTVPGDESFSQITRVADDLRKDGYTVDIAEYDATPFFSKTYPQAARDGVDVANKAIKNISSGCSSPIVSLAGYSLSGDIFSRIASDIGNGKGVIDADELGGVSLLSTPRQGTGSKWYVGSESENGILGPIKAGYGKVKNRVVEICTKGDVICDDTVADSVRGLVPAAMTVDKESPSLPWLESLVSSKAVSPAINSLISATESGNPVDVANNVKKGLDIHGSGYGKKETRIASKFIEKARNAVYASKSK